MRERLRTGLPSSLRPTACGYQTPSNRLSRRALIGAGGGALLVPLLAAPAWGQPVGQDPDSAPASVDAANDRSRHMTIAVTIDGKGPFDFVVDTGADRSVIANSVAMTLGLARQKAIFVEGVVRTVPAETVHIGQLAFGVVRQSNLRLPILPREWLNADGFLGLDMIDNYRVTFDFKNHQLLVEEPRSIWGFSNAPPNTDIVSVDGRGGHLRAMNCRIDGVPVTVFIDTGAEMSVANQALFDALIERDPRYYIKAMPIELNGVTGGSIVGQVVRFNRIRIRDMVFTDGTLVVANLQIFDLWGLADRPALLVGMNFLRQFDRVSIDYRRKQFNFVLSEADMYFAQGPRNSG